MAKLKVEKKTPKTQIQNGSPKEKYIDWNLVNKLLEAGCTGTEIAPHFGIHYETLYDRAYKDFGIMWTEYAQRLRQKGDSSLRAVQYAKALKGDNMMLIWLGKNRLGQRDGEDKNKDSPHHEELKQLLLEVKNAYKPQANTSDQRSEQETEYMGGCSPIREDLQFGSEAD